MVPPRHSLSHKRTPHTLPEKLARSLVTILRFFADLFFRNRYGHRAVFIETIAAIPGMVGGALLHFKCLRKIKEDQGWIQTLLAEAENERMHLLAFREVARPTFFEHILIYLIQFLFIVFYVFFYILSSKLAHRFVGYLEEEAVRSYTEYLEKLETGALKNDPAPPFGIKHWKLHKSARLSDLVKAIREDECHHRDVNHHFSDLIYKKKFRV